MFTTFRRSVPATVPGRRRRRYPVTAADDDGSMRGMLQRLPPALCRVGAVGDNALMSKLP